MPVKCPSTCRLTCYCTDVCCHFLLQLWQMSLKCLTMRSLSLSKMNHMITMVRWLWNNIRGCEGLKLFYEALLTTTVKHFDSRCHKRFMQSILSISTGNKYVILVVNTNCQINSWSHESRIMSQISKSKESGVKYLRVRNQDSFLRVTSQKQRIQSMTWSHDSWLESTILMIKFIIILPFQGLLMNHPLPKHSQQLTQWRSLILWF